MTIHDFVLLLVGYIGGCVGSFIVPRIVSRLATSAKKP